MRWRHQIEAVLCAVFLLTTIVVVAVKTLAPGTAASKSNPQAPLANRLSITSRAKVPPAARYLSLEDSTTGDEGSLWDEGPAYDLSR